MNGRRDTAALEQRLVALAGVVAWPEARDLAPNVRARIAEGARPEPYRRSLFPRPAFGIAIALIALVALTLALVPGARHAVADWLGISGIEIRVTDDVPVPSRSIEAIEDLDLGDEVSFAEAEGAAGFAIREPDASGLGEPRVFVRESPVAMVSLVYEPGPGLPRSNQSGVGLLLSQFRGRYSPDLIKKVGATSTVRPADIGDRGFWFEGTPHSVLFRDEDGNIRTDRIRLAGNTLVWEENGISYRLEADVELAQALRIAQTLE